jgi:cyclophilin family peptidyl-prolyl cis-trans isomerase
MFSLRFPLALVAFLLIGAGCQPAPNMESSAPSVPAPTATAPVYSTEHPAMKNATLVTTKGTITFELFPETAPKAVNNLKTLADQGFYNGIKVHRRIEDFMVQFGDPQTKELPLSDRRIGTGGPGYRFEDELTDNYQYSRGILAMANAGPNTNGSQVFIMLADYPLPKDYTIFGRVTSGMEVVDQFVIGDSVVSWTVTE